MEYWARAPSSGEGHYIYLDFTYRSVSKNLSKKYHRVEYIGEAEARFTEAIAVIQAEDDCSLTL